MDGRDSQVLDVACGDVWLSAAVAARGARRGVGVDLSRTGLTAGRARWSRRQPDTLGRALLVQGNALSCGRQRSIRYRHRQRTDRTRGRPGPLVRELVRPFGAAGALIVSTPYRLTEAPIDRYHVHEFFPGEIQKLLQPLFASVAVSVSHPAWVTSLYTLRGWAWPFRLLVNALSIAGQNPFLRWPLGRYAAQITVLGQGRTA